MTINGHDHDRPRQSQSEAQEAARERGYQDGWDSAVRGYDGRAEPPETRETRGETAARLADRLYSGYLPGVTFPGAVRQEYREGFLEGASAFDADMAHYFPKEADGE